MKKLLIYILLAACTIYGQYNNERTTEQSFENSELFFNSTYVNTFGLKSFRDIMPGLLDDPFMNIYLNPANLPDLKDNDILVYLDFTGDREETEIINSYPYPYYYAEMSYAPTLDPRWLNNSRKEPAPIASLGIITYPLGKEEKELIVGATYQLIHREERFYSVPYWVYNYSPYLDSFNNSKFESNDRNVPVIDRYSGEDHMTTDGHMLTTFAGYSFTDALSLGIGFSGVWHSRNGSYLNKQQDEYGSFDRSEWNNLSMQERNQDYSHTDFSAGLKYKINDKSDIGLKFGYLTGIAEQTFDSESEYIYEYNPERTTTDWSENYSTSSSTQSWKHDGSTKYLGFYFNRSFKEDTIIKVFYRYSNSSIDLTSNSNIADTSYYESNWLYYNDDSQNHYLSLSSTHDSRSSTGQNNSNKHEAGFYVNWDLRENIKFSAGLYYKSLISDVTSTEPVDVRRYSYYHNQTYYNQRPEDYENTYQLDEVKELVWDMRTDYWTIQIPAILEIQANDNIGVLLGINRKLETWEISDETTAYFTLREQNENNVYTKKENFGERYKQPTTYKSENTTDVFAGLKVTVSDKLKISLLVNPEWDDTPRFSQWHLSFYGML